MKLKKRIDHAAAALIFAALSIGSSLQMASAATEYRGPVIGPFPENNGYYARFSGENYKYMSWDQARIFAENLFIKREGKSFRGFLATPNTPTERDYITRGLRPNEDWVGMYQQPGAKSPGNNWRFLNNRSLQWNPWGPGEPDDQRRGAYTRCRLVSFFNGVTYTTDGESSSFTLTANPSSETGCENCAMIQQAGTLKDKECKSHGNGFLVEFRSL